MKLIEIEFEIKLIVTQCCTVPFIGMLNVTMNRNYLSYSIKSLVLHLRQWCYYKEI